MLVISGTALIEECNPLIGEVYPPIGMSKALIEEVYPPVGMSKALIEMCYSPVGEDRFANIKCKGRNT